MVSSCLYGNEWEPLARPLLSVNEIAHLSSYSLAAAFFGSLSEEAEMRGKMLSHISERIFYPMLMDSLAWFFLAWALPLIR